MTVSFSILENVSLFLSNFFTGITTTSNSASTKPGSVVRIYDQKSSSSYIPYCNMGNAQLSFHGYRDAVKFFIAVPKPSSSTLLHQSQTISESSTSKLSIDSSVSLFSDTLVLSGGDGYIDLRTQIKTVDNNDDSTNSNRYVSYIIVWHLNSA